MEDTQYVLRSVWYKHDSSNRRRKTGETYYDTGTRQELRALIEDWKQTAIDLAMRHSVDWELAPLNTLRPTSVSSVGSTRGFIDNRYKYGWPIPSLKLKEKE